MIPPSNIRIAAFPFLFLWLPFAAGIFAAESLALPLRLLLAAVPLCLMAAWILHAFGRRTWITMILIFCAASFLGTAWHTYSKQSYRDHPLRKLPSDHYIDFTGILAKSPSRGKDAIEILIRVEKYRDQQQDTSVNGRIRLSVPNSDISTHLHTFSVGDRIQVSARLSPLERYRNFFSDSGRWMKTSGIHRTGFSKSPLLLEKLKTGRKLSFPRFFAWIRGKIQDRIETFFASPDSGGISQEGAILEALLLGDRRRMDDRLIKSFQFAGIFHLFAISGAHIAIVSFLLFNLFRLIGIPNRTSYLVLIGSLIFYALLVEGRASVFRATIMALVFLLGKFLQKDTRILNTIALSGFIILLLSPFQLFDIGYQLTFAATMGIVLFFPGIMRRLPRLPFRLSEIFAMTLCAQIAILPILACNFHRISFASLILNFAALPMVAVIMAGGWIFLLSGLLGHAVTQIPAAGMEFLINGFIRLAQFPVWKTHASLIVPTPHTAVVVLYYAALGLLLIPLNSIILRRTKLPFFLAAAGFILLHPIPPVSKNLKVTFLDVGQGDCILVEFPGTKKMLIDGGGTSFGEFNIGESVVSEFLWDKGITAIDYLVATHPHPDHIKGLTAVAGSFKIREFWQAEIFHDNPEITALKSELQHDTRIRNLSKNDFFRIGDTDIQILHPGPSASGYTNSNNQSLVIRMVAGSFSFLFPADIEQPVESELITEQAHIASRVLKAPHHGSRTSSSPDFLAGISPEIVVITVGQNNPYQLPSEEVVKRLREFGARIYRSDKHGAVEVTAIGDRLSIRTAVGSHDYQ